ncbi:MAG: methionyl-tRNA formyltransferase [Methylovirgula sp.]
MRIVFMGTPEFAVPTLIEIVEHGHEVAGVYTRPAKPAGRRGLAMLPSPVQVAAERLRLPVLTPQSLKSKAAAQTFAAHRADVAVVVAYGLLLPSAILDAPARGSLNLHGSLLPRWRGAAPIERAIMAGDRQTGVAVMRMDEGLDTGPVALVERTAIGPDDTAAELRKRLAHLGARLMARALADLTKGTLTFTPQSEAGMTYARKITKPETRIQWSKSADELHNLVRALAPDPGAFFDADLGKGLERVKVLRSRPVTGSGGAPGLVVDRLTVACGVDALQLIEVQRAGRTPMSAEEFLRGARIAAGAMFSVIG